MRSSKSRSRSKSNRQRSLGNIVNRVFDSSGPEGKVRGTPQQIIDKYLALARDAQLSNDRVAEESFLQHAEHYTRLLAEALREQAERQQTNGGQGRGDDEARGDARPDDGYRRDGRRDEGRRDEGRRDDTRRDDARREHERKRAESGEEAVPEAAHGPDAAARALPDAIEAAERADTAAPLPEAEGASQPRTSRAKDSAAAAGAADTGSDSAAKASEPAAEGEAASPRPARKTTRTSSRSRSPRKPADDSGEQAIAGD